MNYNESIIDEINDCDAFLMTVDEFQNDARQGFLTDDDGLGFPVKGGMYDSKWYVHPSQLGLIPLDCTHILWYNK